MKAVEREARQALRPAVVSLTSSIQSVLAGPPALALFAPALLALALLAAAPCVAQSGAKPAELELRSDGTAQGVPGRYALIVAVDDYSSEINELGTGDLRYCVKGAQELARVLQEQGGFPESNIKTLFNSKATRQEILLYLSQLGNSAAFPGAETFLFYFSGHGLIVDSTNPAGEAAGRSGQYLMPCNGSAHPALAESENIEMAKVLQLLEDAPNFTRKVVLLDACRIRQSTRGQKAISHAGNFDFAAYASFAQGIVGLNSARASEASWEDERIESGVFTYHLLRAMRGAAGSDSNNDGVISFGEAESYVAAYLADWSRQNPSRAQTPARFGSGNSAIPLTVIRVPESGSLTIRQEAEKLLTAGHKLTQQERQDEALSLYLQAAHTDPSWAAPHFEASYIYYTQQRYPAAISSARECIRLDPRSVVMHGFLGLLYSQTLRYDESIASYREAIRLDPLFAGAHNGLGKVYLDSQRYDEAITSLKEAIRLDPLLSSPHTNLGMVYGALERNEEAIASYREAARLDPQDAVPHNNLGLVYRSLKRYDEAIASLKKAISLDPQWATAHNSLGAVYSDLQRYDEAIECYRKAIQLNPNTKLYRDNLQIALDDKAYLGL